MMDAGKQFLNEFIDCYQAGPALWDATIPEYTCRQKKLIIYNQLLRIMKKYKKDASLQDVKKKINTLRSNYRREMKRVQSSIEMREFPVYVPNLWWFEKFDFLKNLNQNPTQVYSNYSVKHDEIFMDETVLNEIEDDIHSDESDTPEMTIKIEEPSLEETYIKQEEDQKDNSQTEETFFMKPDYTVRKRHVEETLITPEEIAPVRPPKIRCIQPMPMQIRNNDDNLRTNNSSLPNTSSDSGVSDTVDHMCKAWAGDLREMDKHQRIIAGRAISEIIFQGQLGVLTLDSIPQMPRSTSSSLSTSKIATKSSEFRIQPETSSSKPKVATKCYSNPRIVYGRTISIEANRAKEQSYSLIAPDDFS
ncbi:uncharacterized protein LOC129905564 [Episyrphus balteatus]|uniref:uncharacterized protein LOC129905564 n=1 Tax=Episyrphus balteatus TaxID=286459 RepID=UPI0024857274|nr:uncharacterized protein LOC129905564 [Episyrphus balteatus]